MIRQLRRLASHSKQPEQLSAVLALARTLARTGPNDDAPMYSDRSGAESLTIGGPQRSIPQDEGNGHTGNNGHQTPQRFLVEIITEQSLKSVANHVD